MGRQVQSFLPNVYWSDVIMLLLCVFAILVTKLDFLNSAILDNHVEDKELLLAFVVNRHGERTPAEEEVALSHDPKTLKDLIQVEGYEGLTNQGKRRAYQIGKFLRHRYGSNQGHSLLSKLYLQDEIAVRSTDKERTKMTAQIAMAAVYPPAPSQQWDDGLGKIWQPVPYTAVPLSEDYLRFYSSCASYKVLLQNAKREAVLAEFAQYNDLLPLLKEKTGADFSEDPLLFQTLIDLFRAQIGLGLEVPAWAQPLLTRLHDAATLAYKLYLRTDEMKKYGGGVMLNDFIQTSNAIISGEDVKKRVRLFSSHDFNLGALMEVSKVEEADKSIPEYGALFALELYRSRDSGQYYVLPIYVNQVGDSTTTKRKITGCGDHFCDYEKFSILTKDFLLPEEEFYRKCSIKKRL